MNELVEAPLLQLSYLMAREFGWTPGELREMTMVQLEVYRQMLANDGRL